MTTAEKASNLARVLDAGHFAVAVEISPPIGPNPQALQRQIDRVKGYADVYNVTDNQSARVHMATGLYVGMYAMTRLENARFSEHALYILTVTEPTTR